MARHRRAKPWPKLLYPSGSPTGRYIMFRDGVEVARGTDGSLAAYIHRHHSYSFDHALRYEGYSVKPDTSSEGHLL